MIVAVTGSSGLIGTALCERLRATGHEVLRLVRGPATGPGTASWDPAGGTVDHEALASADAVVHLAGEGIGERRWSDEQKRRIRESRTRGTATVAGALAALAAEGRGPATLLSGSAIGWYGDTGQEAVDEAAPAGEGFLASVVVDWEAAAAPAVDAGLRVAYLRTGIVLSPSGGAVQRQLPLFKAGLGGKLGSGRQWWSWISLEDEVEAILHLLTHDVAGPVNLTAPMPVTNAEFTEVLGRVLRRPTFLPVPAFGPRLLLGRELADALLYTSQRVEPSALEASGYTFHHPELEGALRALLGRG